MSNDTCAETPAPEADPDHDPVGALLNVLDLAESEATTEDIFTGVSQPMPSGRAYGGQVLSQAIVAAERTVPDARAVHSMHGYFLRPGDAGKDITFSVDRIHDGRSFSTRRTQAFQDGKPIFSMIASFQEEDPGLEHHVPMPDGIPAPEELPNLLTRSAGAHPLTRRLFADHPVDVRHVPSPVYVSADVERLPRQAVWLRARRLLPDDPSIHRAALAYLSDLTIQEPILRAHGLSWSIPGLKMASLDHAMWWHRPGRADEWMLYVQESPSARGGRGLSTGRIYTRDGRLLASVAQEAMVRIPDRLS